jgi:hypothetical protein
LDDLVVEKLGWRVAVVLKIANIGVILKACCSLDVCIAVAEGKTVFVS